MRDGRIEYLIRLVEKSDIAELEITEGRGQEIRITKLIHPAPVMPVVAAPGIPAPAPAPQPAEPVAVPAPPVLEDANLIKVVSPMVGTFYRAASPDAPAFVDVGSQVQPGQTLCIIEAMKIMNEIASEVAGSVRKILVDNGQPVEFGQTLFLVEKSA